MRLAILALLLAIAGCASPVGTVRTAALQLTMDDGTCSGTAVGPHTLLTAEHCLTGSHTLAIDGKPVSIRKVLLDGHDHALVRVDQAFSHWATTGIEPQQGDAVFILGNPGVLRDMYRKAYVSGRQVFQGKELTLYDLNGYLGDSGSGIFNADGQLVGVISLMYQQSGVGYMKLMASYSLEFTQAQWSEAI